MKSRPFGRSKTNKWIVRFTHKRFRRRVNQAIKRFLSIKSDDEPHIPQWKDINNPWNWD